MLSLLHTWAFVALTPLAVTECVLTALRQMVQGDNPVMANL